MQICTLTSLTYLKLCFNETHEAWMMKGKLMDSLTKLQVLNELKLSFPPKLPLVLSQLANLQSLTVGPGLSSQRLLQICTLTGLTYLKLQFHKTDPEWMSNGMPMDSLTELQLLNELKLYFPPRLPLLLSQLASLRCLTVAPRTAVTLDMSALTQVCSLHLSQAYNKHTRVAVFVPAGSAARLSALAIHTLCSIQNLHKAKKLKQIDISAKPAIMYGVGWAVALPNLQRLTVCKVTDHYVLPDHWQFYTQLRCLYLPYYEGSLPVWFSKLQQLKALSMPDAQIDGSPESLFHLSELKRLNLSRFQGLLTMPIVKVADLPQLTYFKFGNLGHTLPQDEQAVLLDLEIALSKREPKLKKEHPNEWTYVLDTCH